MAPDAAGHGHDPVVFVDDLARPEVSDDDRHHLERVLRLRSGTPVTLSDGEGAWRSALWGDEPELTSEIHPSAHRSRAGVGFAIPKGDRLDFAVAKLTELGVTRLILLQCDRSVVAWPTAKTEAKRARLERICRSSAMQSRRLVLPQIEGPTSPRQAAEAGAAMAVPGASAPPTSHTSLLIGPEGGWSDAELELTDAHVGLGPGVLRIETAAIVAGALLSASEEVWWGR